MYWINKKANLFSINLFADCLKDVFHTPKQARDFLRKEGYQLQNGYPKSSHHVYKKEPIQGDGQSHLISESEYQTYCFDYNLNSASNQQTSIQPEQPLSNPSFGDLLKKSYSNNALDKYHNNFQDEISKVFTTTAFPPPNENALPRSDQRHDYIFSIDAFRISNSGAMSHPGMIMKGTTLFEEINSCGTVSEKPQLDSLDEHKDPP